MRFSKEFFLVMSLIFFITGIRNLCIMGWDPANLRWFLAVFVTLFLTMVSGLYIWDYFYNLGKIRRRS